MTFSSLISRSAWLPCLLTLLLIAPASMAQPAASGPDDFAAARLLRTAEENIEAGAGDRGVAMLENLLERFPGTAHRFKASLLLARYFVEQNQDEAARPHLRRLITLDRAFDELSPEQELMLQEALYLHGRSAFNRQNYAEAFPSLRRIIRDFPNSRWANEAYFYIGMAHFTQENWQGAIETLALVGTVGEAADADNPFIEAGRRFYIRLEDPDLPILHRMGERITVRVETDSGDREVVECIPIQSGADVFMGSIATVVGAPAPGDNRLQVRGGDTVRVFYVDRNTEGGDNNVERLMEKKVVSTGRLFFTPGNWEGSTEVGFVGQPAYIELEDVDLSVSDQADTVTVTVVSRYAVEEEEDDDVSLILSGGEEDEAETHVERDSIRLTLREHADGAPVRSGLFRGRVDLIHVNDDAEAEADRPRLRVEIGDEIVVFYTDELHLGGAEPREVTSLIRVSGDLQSVPRATQYVVDDPILRAEKHLVEAGAFIELARIFREMGLRIGSDERADEALELLRLVLQDAENLSVPILEQTYRKKWETEILKGDYQTAIRTCSEFARRFPDSPLVEDAFLRIAGIYMEDGERQSLGRARTLYQTLLRTGTVATQAEAAYQLALISQQSNPTNPGVAIPHFQNVAERFPESPHAGEALSRVIDFHIEQGNFPVAIDLLEQVFSDQPDAPYLDSMLMKWVAVALRRGDFRTAAEKAEQLLFDYPGSRFATRAQELLPRIRQRL